jgi:hypothetical protein
MNTQFYSNKTKQFLKRKSKLQKLKNTLHWLLLISVMSITMGMLLLELTGLFRLSRIIG